MAVTTPKGIKSTAIKAPTNYLENHTTILQQLKETTEIAQRLRGDVGDSFVRVSELVKSGIIRINNGVVQPPTAVPSTSGTASPLTTKGDLYTYDTGNQRLPVGTNTWVLTADSSQATGLAWAPAPGAGSGLTQAQALTLVSLRM